MTQIYTIYTFSGETGIHIFATIMDLTNCYNVFNPPFYWMIFYDFTPMSHWPLWSESLQQLLIRSYFAPSSYTLHIKLQLRHSARTSLLKSSWAKRKNSSFTTGSQISALFAAAAIWPDHHHILKKSRPNLTASVGQCHLKPLFPLSK